MRKLLAVLLFPAVCTPLYSQSPSSSADDIEEVRGFIKDSWDQTIRFHTEDQGPLFGLPYPYTVPSVSGAFQEMYYWDTFFTGEGLIIDGRVEQARYNVEDMLYMVERFGKMLNGNRVEFLNRSQSPYLSMMIASVYRCTGDKEWLRKVLPPLEKEYRFWMTERITPVGLNRCGNNATDEDKLGFVEMLKVRLGENFRTDGLTREQLLQIGSHHIAEAESWDFTPRYKMRCMDFCPVDLNSNLYLYEKNFEFFCNELGDKKGAKEWAKTAGRRKKLMRKYMRDPQTGMFYDYDYVNGVRSDVISAAVFNLLFAKAVSAGDAKGVVKALDVLEYPYGIATCEDKPYDFKYQWSFPNGWAPCQYIAICGLENYGYHGDAERIAAKYIDIVVRNYKATGNLWEKYNVVEGNVNVSNEYQMPTMIGWTAGIFAFADEYLKKQGSGR